MGENPRLLVVDDEQVICHACKRIFARQGFEVDVTTDALEGLEWATERVYAAILLDIKMPRIDGIQFLERLRAQNADVPVLIMTGYPSVPNAAAAIRLGAADYVTKPFTPEEITRAVQRVIATHRVSDTVEAEPDTAAASPAADGVFFYDEACFRLESDGSACVGALLPGLRGATIACLRLPRIGEVVYQGLPLAGVEVVGKPLAIVPAPLTGVIAAVNDALPHAPQHLWDDPCGEGWIACVCSTRYEDEVTRCRRRQVLLANADAQRAAFQQQRLAALGCEVVVAGDAGAVLAAAGQPGAPVALIDGVSWGAGGPGLVEKLNIAAHALKIVVLGDQHCAETDYRKHRIFYYAVAAFADNEIIDILDAAFRVQEPVATVPRHKAAPEAIRGMSITNRNGHKVQLLAAPGLLWRAEGLGGEISDRLLAHEFPLVITPGEANLAPANLLKAAALCDRLIVLLTKDSGALPGSLARDTRPHFSVAPDEAAENVTMWTVQPDAVGGLTGWSERTTAALAEHIVHEMATY